MATITSSFSIDTHRACTNQTLCNHTRTGVKFDGAFSPYEQCQTLVGAVSEKLGLPGNPASAYVKARSKHACRQALKAAGVPTPKVCVNT